MIWWAILLAYLGGEIAGSILINTLSQREKIQYYSTMGTIAAGLIVAYLAGWNSSTVGYLLASAAGLINPISLRK